LDVNSITHFAGHKPPLVLDCALWCLMVLRSALSPAIRYDQAPSSTTNYCQAPRTI